MEEFNSPPLVESADTAPFFHNHTVADLESAVAFYGTPAFQASIPGRNPLGGMQVQISSDPNDPEVQAIAAFLRMLNALENIRSSINVAERGRTMTTVADMRELARLSLAETIDAIQVLVQRLVGERSRAWHPVGSCATACWQSGARGSAAIRGSAGGRQPLNVALRNLRAARTDLADPASLPPSFRN